jgi:hypothetical protein
MVIRNISGQELLDPVFTVASKLLVQGWTQAL